MGRWGVGLRQHRSRRAAAATARQGDSGRVFLATDSEEKRSHLERRSSVQRRWESGPCSHHAGNWGQLWLTHSYILTLCWANFRVCLICSLHHTSLGRVSTRGHSQASLATLVGARNAVTACKGLLANAPPVRLCRSVSRCSGDVVSHDKKQRTNAGRELFCGRVFCLLIRPVTAIPSSLMHVSRFVS